MKREAVAQSPSHGQSMRRPIVGAGLKMFLGYAATVSYLDSLAEYAQEFEGASVFVLPSFPLLAEARRVLSGSPIAYGAQDGHWEEWGPFTGCVSPAMLAELGCTIMEVGHAERRRHLGEDDAMIAGKVAAAVRSKLVPIVCVGEQSEGPDATQVVVAQTRAALASLPSDDAPIIVAYEPVWKIGADSPASADHVARAVAAVRSATAERRGAVHVLYGGSVAAGRIRRLLTAGVDGVFVGREALQILSFRRIVHELREAA